MTVLDGRHYAAAANALLATLTCHRCDRPTRTIRNGLPVCTDHDHGSPFNTARR
jgi:hypothetical protein